MSNEDSINSFNLKKGRDILVECTTLILIGTFMSLVKRIEWGQSSFDSSKRYTLSLIGKVDK